MSRMGGEDVEKLGPATAGWVAEPRAEGGDARATRVAGRVSGGRAGTERVGARRLEPVERVSGAPERRALCSGCWQVSGVAGWRRFRYQRGLRPSSAQGRRSLSHPPW